LSKISRYAAAGRESSGTEKLDLPSYQSRHGLSAKIEIYQGNMKATTGERPHVKISAAAKVSDVQIYLASQSSGSSKQSVMKVEEVNERLPERGPLGVDLSA
jgi:hypothetical protein